MSRVRIDQGILIAVAGMILAGLVVVVVLAIDSRGEKCESLNEAAISIGRCLADEHCSRTLELYRSKEALSWLRQEYHCEEVTYGD